MSAVTVAEAWPKPGEPFTVDDLDRMPDDGRRYELIDGILIVSPVPAMPHQRVGFFLGMLLEEACPDDLGRLRHPGERPLLAPQCSRARCRRSACRKIPGACAWSR